MLHSSIQSSSPSNPVHQQQQHYQLPMHSKYHYAMVIGGSGIALLSCCRGIKDGREGGHLKPAKVILMAVLLINIGLLAFAQANLNEGGWASLDQDRLKVCRIVCIAGATLELLFLIAFFFLDSLLLASVYAFLAVMATIGTALATLLLHYPPLWLEVLICALMGVCSMLLMLDYAAEQRERLREREVRGRRRSSSSSSVPIKV